MSVAKSYARALHEAAVETKVSSSETEKMESQMDQFQALLDSSKEIRVALLGPATAAKDKAAIVEQVSSKLGVAPLVRLFFLMLARKERLNLLPEIRTAFTEVRLESQGGMLGTLVSADPLAQADVDGMAQAFSQKFGKKVAFRTQTDPSLLAGIKVVVNGVTYDGTLRSQLQRLRDRVVHGMTGSA